jgi:hypothetical protein
MDDMKPTLPEIEELELFTFDIYDASDGPDDGLVWLLAEEQLPELGLLTEPRESLSWASQGVWELRPVALASTPGHKLDKFLEPELNQYEVPNVPLVPSDHLENSDPVGMVMVSSPLTYKVSVPSDQVRWLFRVTGLVSILLIGSLLLPILEHLHSTPLKSSAALASSLTKSQSVFHSGSEPVRVLTIMAGREDTIRDISFRYAGHFDQDLLEEIYHLNPNLKAPNDHLEDGQLIRIPLRRIPTSDLEE